MNRPVLLFFPGLSGSNRRNDCCFIFQRNTIIYFLSLSAILRNKHVCLYIHVHIHSTSHLVNGNAFPSLVNIKERVLFVLLIGSVCRRTVQSRSCLVRENSAVRQMSITSTSCRAVEHGCTFEDFYKQRE